MEKRTDVIEEIKNRRAAAANPGIATNTKELIDLRKAEGSIKIKSIKASEPAKSVAGKHLAKLGAFYLLVLVLAFIYSIQTLPAEAVAVVAGLVTLVVTHISSLLKSIVEDREQKDPIELMYDIAEENSKSCERQHISLIGATERAQRDLLEATERQHSAIIKANQESSNEMVRMLKEAQESLPTSLSIKPNDVVIQQGSNTVTTSTRQD